MPRFEVGTRPIILLVLFSAAPATAQQATTAPQITTAYGARVGVRNGRADVPGFSQDLRAVKRLETRVESRIDTRITRYTDPTRALSSYRSPETRRPDPQRLSTNAPIANQASGGDQPPPG